MSNMIQSKFDVGERKIANISEDRNGRYIHFQDKITTNRKKMSFSFAEYFEMLAKTSIIKEAFTESNKKIKRQSGG